MSSGEYVINLNQALKYIRSSVVSLFNNGDTFFMINIYSNDSQSALKYLKSTKANIHVTIDASWGQHGHE